MRFNNSAQAQTAPFTSCGGAQVAVDEASSAAREARTLPRHGNAPSVSPNHAFEFAAVSEVVMWRLVVVMDSTVGSSSNFSSIRRNWGSSMSCLSP